MNEQGQPTPEFIHWWEQQRGVNRIVVPLETPEEVSAILDVIGDTPGAMLVRDASEWVVLLPGAQGDVLTAQGAGQVPVWASIPTPVTDFISLSDTPIDYTGQAGMLVAVNATEDGLIFIPNTGGGGGSIVFAGAQVTWLDGVGIVTPYNFIAWDVANFDTHGFWNPARAGEFVIPTGVNMVRLTLFLSGDSAAVSSASHATALVVYLNGVRAGSSYAVPGYTDAQLTLTTPPIEVQSGDVLHARINTQSTGTRNFLAGSSFSIEVLDGTPVGAPVAPPVQWQTSPLHAGLEVVAEGASLVNRSGSNLSYTVITDLKIETTDPKVYWEMRCDNGAATFDGYVGTICETFVNSVNFPAGHPVNNGNLAWRGNGTVWGPNNAQDSSGYPSYGKEKTCMFCYDPASGGMWVGADGVWHADPDSDPASYSTAVEDCWVGGTARNINDRLTVRSRAEDFTYPVPSTAVPLASLV